MPLGTSRALEAARLKTAQERDLAAAIESLAAKLKKYGLE